MNTVPCSYHAPCTIQLHTAGCMTKICHLVISMAYNQPESESDSSGWLADNVLPLCTLPGTPHAHHVFVLWPCRGDWGHKGTSSRHNPAASLKCHGEGGREAVSGSHPKGSHESKLNTDKHQHLTKCCYKNVQYTQTWHIKSKADGHIKLNCSPRHLSCQAQSHLFVLATHLSQRRDLA